MIVFLISTSRNYLKRHYLLILTKIVMTVMIRVREMDKFALTLIKMGGGGGGFPCNFYKRWN